MRRPSRLFTVLALLAGGTAVALVSHRHLDTATTPVSPQLRKPPTSLGPLPLALPEESPQPARLSGQIEAAEPVRPRAVDPLRITSGPVSTIRPCEPPPLGDDPWRPSARMASYQSETSECGVSAGIKPDAAPSRPPIEKRAIVNTMHRIVDGDTLSGLAHRYLGSSGRFREIFDANRDRLQSPDLLPIGVELRIPAVVAGRAD